MNVKTRIMDPTSEREATARPKLPRPATLDGLTVAVLDISKVRGDVFVNHVGDLLDARGIAVKRYRKPTVARTAPLEIQEAIVDACDIVVEGLAD